jgi:rod shape determining protein RodA
LRVAMKRRTAFGCFTRTSTWRDWPRVSIQNGSDIGLIGNVVLLSLYALLVVRGLAIAAQAPTQFARLLAGAVTLVFFTYAFVNMGMVAGILPVVGVPLPFVSYGGTALATLYVGVGILMSVHRHRKLVQT